MRLIDRVSQPCRKPHSLDTLVTDERSLTTLSPVMTTVPASAHVFLTLLPITVAVFIAFLTIGMQMALR